MCARDQRHFAYNTQAVIIIDYKRTRLCRVIANESNKYFYLLNYKFRIQSGDLSNVCLEANQIKCFQMNAVKMKLFILSKIYKMYNLVIYQLVS